MSRIEPLQPPYEPHVRGLLESMMPPGVAPIALFRTFANNIEMTRALIGWGRYELSKELSLGLRDREIVIDRTCARLGCEYEWGVHVAFFSAAAELDRDQIASLIHGDACDPCWATDRDRLLIRAVDELCDTSTLGVSLFAELGEQFDGAELLDLLMLCGWYHAIAFVANAAEVESEPMAPTFGDYHREQPPTARVDDRIL